MKALQDQIQQDAANRPNSRRYWGFTKNQLLLTGITLFAPVGVAIYLKNSPYTPALELKN